MSDAQPKNTATPGDVGAAASDRRTMMQNALGTIERLQAKLDASEQQRSEPIAIIGVGLRAPGGVVDAESYWDLLANGVDAVTEVPPDRWDVDAFYDPDARHAGKAHTKSGGFLDNIDHFEPALFGMSPREAAGVDPQHRLLLECAWEAMERAGIAPDSLDGSRTGVFVGITTTDYTNRIMGDPARSDIYLATGTAMNAAAGRISFTFGLRGPCIALDTACSSSLVATHTACQSLRNRECNLALSGGVNAMLSPVPFVIMSKWGMLSPVGRCKTFDASADGFVRSEGCGVVILERLSDAIANKRNILAVIRGSAINQDGHSSGLTVPNGIAQEEVVRSALAAARVRPSEVSYVEAHGTGTSLGDPIELEALGHVFSEGRADGDKLEIGSVKSNIGHPEAASGVLGLVKVALALQKRRIPASLHVTEPTPAVHWETMPLRVSTVLHDWTTRQMPRIGGVSAFGFSGMNAHAVLGEAPVAIARNSDRPSRGMHVLPISARTNSALCTLASRYAQMLRTQPDLEIADVCATASTGRAQLAERFAFVAADRESLIAELERAANGESAAARGHVGISSRGRVAFLFTGQGSQYAGMGRELYESEPAFREAFDRCAAVLDPVMQRPLHSLVIAEGEGLDQTGNTQPALYALQVSLAALWKSWGIVPSAVIGHSVGEFAAAAIAGVFSIEDGARLIAARARLMQALPEGGVMLSVQGDADVIAREVARFPRQVSIGARNAPDNIVISGVRARVEEVRAALEARGFRTKPLVVSHAFHSPLMQPMVAEFQAIAAGVKHHAPTVAWYSNITGDALDWSVWADRMSEYWARHVMEPVSFERGMRALASSGIDLFAEIGPHPVLSGLAQLCVADEARATALHFAASLKRNKSAGQTMAESVAALWVNGARLSWTGVHEGRRQRGVLLPTYPFERQRFITDVPQPTGRVEGRSVHELLGAQLDLAGAAAQFERRITNADPSWLADHRIGSDPVVPMTAYLEMALAAARRVHTDGNVSLEGFEIGEAMMLPDGSERVLQVGVTADAPGASTVRVYSRDGKIEGSPWLLHATVRALASSASSVQSDFAAAGSRCDAPVDVESFYEKLRGMSVDFGASFRLMRKVWKGTGEAIGEISSSPFDQEELGHYTIHPALLDGCLHVAATVLDGLSDGNDSRIYLTFGLDSYSVSGLALPAGSTLRSHARVRDGSRVGDMVVLDVEIETTDGDAVAQLSGMRCRRVARDPFRKRAEQQAHGWLYRVAWKELAPSPDAAAFEGAYLIFDDGQGRGGLLADEIFARGGNSFRVIPGDILAFDDATGVLTIDPANAEHYVAALEHAVAQSGTAGLRSIVTLWPLRMPQLNATMLPSTVQKFGTDSALLLLQSLISERAASLGLGTTRLCIITTSSQNVDGNESLRIEQAPVAGFARVATTEFPDLRVTHVDLDAQVYHTDTRAFADLLTDTGDERQVAYRKGVRFVARLERFQAEASSDDVSVRLDIKERGTLEGLQIEPDARRAPGPGQVEIRVRASGLNFRDVLSALGMYPEPIERLGSDCAGDVVAIGEGVTTFAVGDRVVAMTDGAFATYTTTRWEFVAHLPEAIEYEEGAAIPSAFMTSDITLRLTAGIKRGDRVLIHAGAGGVGMAAIALAQRAGAEIFATAGSPEKRAALSRLGVQHVFDSRSTSFADEVMRVTNGTGVDIVLNSLSGAIRDRSFDVVCTGGTFLEIGKLDAWPPERVDALQRDIRYHVVDCNDNAQRTPELVGQIFTRVLGDLASGALPLLPYITFDFARAREAFAYMAQARHLGRVVLRHRSAPAGHGNAIHSDAAYLITGGLRGLGLEAARWLVGEGARTLVLAGRSAPDEDAQRAIAEFRTAGAEVVALSADVSSAEGIATIVAELSKQRAPLRGVMHLAAVLDDGSLSNQTAARFARVFGPKADGAWRLDRALVAHDDTLDFVVYFSSLSAVFGSPGQGNYVAANAFLDALATRRVNLHRPATSINWGAWKDVGMAARSSALARANSNGFPAMSPAEGMAALGVVLRAQPSVVAVSPIDWPTLLRQLDNDKALPLLEDLFRDERAGKSTSDATGGGVLDTRVNFSLLDGKERQVAIGALIRRELAAVLALGTAAIEDDQPFPTLGLDSLTAVELRNRLQRALGRPVPATAAFDWPTIQELTDELNAGFRASAARNSAPREEFAL